MSGTELTDLEALLIRVISDPSAFGRAVMEQLMDRLAMPSPRPAPVTVPGTLVSDDVHEAMKDRNVLLAAALGACECWGTDFECTECSGRGSAGWRIPDAQLYEEYVGPAISRASDGDHEARPHEMKGRDHADMAGQQ